MPWSTHTNHPKFFKLLRFSKEYNILGIILKTKEFYCIIIRHVEHLQDLVTHLMKFLKKNNW
jgi:hypothetical protein